MKTNRIICLYGGPSSGKSTTAHGLVYAFKQKGFEAEMNPEYVKDWVYQKRPINDGDQTYFFAKSSRKERSLMNNGLDFIITDSPLILTHYYGMKQCWLEQNFNTSLVLLQHHHAYCKHMGYKVDHFFMNRVKPYSPLGRYQTEEQANIIDGQIRDMLNNLGIQYKEVNGDSSAVIKIMHYMENN